MAAGAYNRKNERAKQKARERAAKAALVTEKETTERQQETAQGKADQERQVTEPYIEPSAWDRPKGTIERPVERGIWAWCSRPSLTDWLLTSFTLVLAIIGIRQLLAMNGQLTAMNGQVGLMQGQLDAMQVDDRAWMSASVKLPVELNVGKPLLALVDVKNVGKTVATNVSGETTIQMVVNGEEPTFLTPHIHSTFRAGIAIPNDPAIEDNIIRWMGGRTDYAPQFLSAGEVKSYNEGQLWLAIFGRITYTDVFGKSHWIQFCVPQVSKTATVKYFTYGSCTDFNQIDDQRGRDRPT